MKTGPDAPTALADATSAALVAVTDLLKAARRAGNRDVVEAGEYCLEALVVAVDGIDRPAPPPVMAWPANVIPFPGRR